MSDSVNRK